MAVTISGFTFIRNGEMLGYPFLQSIRSALPLCDEYIVNVGPSDDATLEMIESINDPKIKVVKSFWNEKMKCKGFVYGQQTMIAHFNCSGDWVLNLQGDELLHEDDIPLIRQAAERHSDNDNIEALAFRYKHFYANTNTYLWSSHWYRSEARMIKNNLRVLSPSDGLYWTVIDKDNKKSRYPRAALLDATIYHYGYVRSDKQMNKKLDKVGRYWNSKHDTFDYGNIDARILRAFQGTHPSALDDFFPEANGIFQANPDYQLTKRDKKHRLANRIETLTGLDLSRKHYKLV